MCRRVARRCHVCVYVFTNSYMYIYTCYTYNIQIHRHIFICIYVCIYIYMQPEARSILGWYSRDTVIMLPSTEASLWKGTYISTRIRGILGGGGASCEEVSRELEARYVVLGQYPRATGCIRVCQLPLLPRFRELDNAIQSPPPNYSLAYPKHHQLEAMRS